MTMKVVDRFTTQDGKWYPTADKYGITSTMWEKYRKDAQYLGGATHLYVHAPDGSFITFRNRYGNPSPSMYADASKDGGWVNLPLYKGDVYYPDQGQLGTYDVLVGKTVVAEGLGLPESWHVSTFLVVKDVADSVTPPVVVPPVPVPPAQGQYVQVVIETMSAEHALLKREVVWHSVR